MKYLKKYYKLIILVIICIFIYYIYLNTSNKNITYITLGDGYSIGINPYGKKDYGYNDYLKNYLEENNRLHKYYDNYSYNNMLIKDLYNDILINNTDKETLKQALRNSNLLTLSIGINDLVYKYSINNNISNMEENEIVDSIILDFDTLIDEIKKYYKGKIYLIGYYNNFKDKKLIDLLNELNNKYKAYSKNNDLVYIEIKSNLNSYFDNPNTNYPNTLGYKQIYNEILNEIELN